MILWKNKKDLLPLTIFQALADARINVRMIDQVASELNIIIGVLNEDFESAIRAIYNIFTA